MKISVIQKTLIGALSLMLVVVLIIMGVSVWVIFRIQGTMLANQVDKAKITAINMSEATGDYIMMGETERLNQILDSMKKADPEIVYAHMHALDGSYASSTEKKLVGQPLGASKLEVDAQPVQDVQIHPDPKNKKIIEVVTPSNFGGIGMGVLRIGYTTEKLQNTIIGAITLFILVSFVLLVIGLYFFWYIVERRIVERVLATATSLDQSGLHMVQVASDVSTTAHNLAESGMEQAAAVEETASTVEEIASTVARNADSAVETQRMVNHARVKVDESLRQVSDLKESVNRVEKSTSEMSAAMEGIKSSSDAVSKIIKTIDEIAFQTNILALNAAVEAARAGDAGLGFAVVADEVRNLALRSAEAARETSALIDDSIAKSGAAADIGDKVFKMLKEIFQKVQSVDGVLNLVVTDVRQADTRVAEIATASQEQSRSVQQVNTALEQMSLNANLNANMAQTSAKASELLTEQTKVLCDAVEHLLMLMKVSDASSNGGTGTVSETALALTRTTSLGSLKTQPMASVRVAPEKDDFI